VSIVLTRRVGGVSVLIEDDGHGFDVGEVGNGSLGLVGMRERIALIGGTLSVESASGEGTTISAYAPVIV
jgi:signal transduction histidine kinase